MTAVMKFFKSISFTNATSMKMALRPLILISELLGMSPFSISKGEGDKIYSISKTGIFFSAISISFYLYCLVYSKTIIIKWKFLQDDVIKFVGVILQIGTGFISMIAVCANGFIIGQIVPKWFKRVENVDISLSTINVIISYRNLQFLVFLFVAESITSVLVYLFLHYMNTIVKTGKFNIFFSVSYIYPFMNINLHTFRYIITLYILFERFHVINNEIVQEAELFQNNSHPIRNSFNTTIEISSDVIINTAKIESLLTNLDDLCNLLIYAVYFHGVVDVVTKLVVFTNTIFNLYYLIVTYIFYYDSISMSLVCAIIGQIIFYQIQILYFLKVAQSCVKGVSTKYCMLYY